MCPTRSHQPVNVNRNRSGDPNGNPPGWEARAGIMIGHQQSWAAGGDISFSEYIRGWIEKFYNLEVVFPEISLLKQQRIPKKQHTDFPWKGVMQWQ